MVFTYTFRVIRTILKGISVGPRITEPIHRGTVLTTKHRCQLSDVDFFLHMNNSMYLRHAELARWELLPRTGLLQKTINERWMFLAVEQRTTYKKEVKPFSRFQILTSVAIEHDKWLNFCHRFVDMKNEKTFAVCDVRAVIKRASGELKGKTVRPSEMPDIFLPEN